MLLSCVPHAGPNIQLFLYNNLKAGRNTWRPKGPTKTEEDVQESVELVSSLAIVWTFWSHLHLCLDGLSERETVDRSKILMVFVDPRGAQPNPTRNFQWSYVVVQASSCFVPVHYLFQNVFITCLKFAGIMCPVTIFKLLGIDNIRNTSLWNLICIYMWNYYFTCLIWNYFLMERT